MAAAAPSLASALAQDAARWADPNPDHERILDLVGGAAATARDAASLSMLDVNQRSPVALCFVLTGDSDHIYVGHSLTRYPVNPGAATPFDGRVVALVGDDIANAVPVVLQADAFARPNAIHAKTADYMAGANGHGAAPQVFRFDPSDGTDGDATEVRIRRCFPMAAGKVAAALSSEPTGQYTLLNFYARFLQADLASGDAAVVAAATPLRDWWRLACTNTAAGAANTVPAVDQVAAGNPIHAQGLGQWVAQLKVNQLRRLGAGGPALTTAAFQQGIQDLRDALTEGTTQTLEFHREANNKTFTDKHGAALAQTMHRWCDPCADDDHLPEVHQLLSKNTNKARDYAIVTSKIAERVAASPLPVTAANSPLASPKLVDEVFRALQPASTGQTFGSGLTPFAVICEGHKEMKATRDLIRRATLVEGAGNLTLDDAEKIVSTDVRFPTTPQVATEKLYGWSIFIDLFHGATTAIATNVRAFALCVGPCLPSVYENAGGTDATGMDHVNRVLYEAQQEYFTWAMGKGAGRNPAVPDFMSIQGKVTTYRVASLSPLPASWYTLLGAPLSSPRGEQGTPRAVSGSVATVYQNPDRNLIVRFRDSTHTSIGSLMEGHEVEIPKHQGREVCLTWALKGSCSANCRRAAAHTRYPASVNAKLHSLLDACGVANPEQ